LVSNLLLLRTMAPFRSLPFLCSALLLTLAGTGHALQLGETEAQMMARHGAPAVEDHGRQLAVYYWEGWASQAEFKEGLVHRLSYRRLGYLTEAEIQALLQANGGVARWKETTNRGAKTRQWTRDDGANAQAPAVRPSTIVFQTGRDMTPSETILNDSFLQFAAPENPTVASTPVPASGRVGAEPMVLSNSAPKVEPEVQVKTAAISTDRVPEVFVEENAKPVEATAEEKTISSEAASGERPKPVLPPVPAVAPAEKGGVSGLLMVIVSVALGALVFGAMLLRKKKAVSQPVPARPAPARPVVPSTPAASTTASSVEAAPVASPTPTPAHGDPATTELQAMRWEQFELLVGEIFRRHGYVVELSAALGADGSVDLMLRRDGECIPVQCKYWKTSRITDREVREFYGTMTDTAAPRGIFVTMGSFSRDAREFAEGKAIELLDGAALEQRIEAIRRPEENIFDITSWIGDFTAAARIFDPECPCCRGAMVIRHNRSNGSAYWGCATYPRCAGKRDPRTDLLAAA
jgi:hypothetical protein